MKVFGCVFVRAYKGVLCISFVDYHPCLCCDFRSPQGPFLIRGELNIGEAGVAKVGCVGNAEEEKIDHLYSAIQVLGVLLKLPGSLTQCAKCSICIFGQFGGKNFLFVKLLLKSM